jgi:hypothetical protein
VADHLFFIFFIYLNEKKEEEEGCPQTVILAAPLLHTKLLAKAILSLKRNFQQSNDREINKEGF